MVADTIKDEISMAMDIGIAVIKTVPDVIELISIESYCIENNF
jgi:hypothetical protein